MSFDDALQFVLQQEGGFVNNPNDPGGATNRGVTQGTYDRYRSAQGVAPRAVSGIADGEVSDIYQTQYWTAARCMDIEQLDAGLALVVFDTAVNSGVGEASRILQRSGRSTSVSARGRSRATPIASSSAAGCSRRRGGSAGGG